MNRLDCHLVGGVVDSTMPQHECRVSGVGVLESDAHVQRLVSFDRDEFEAVDFGGASGLAAASVQENDLDLTNWQTKHALFDAFL